MSGTRKSSEISLAMIIWSHDWNATNGQAIVTRQVIEGQPKICWIYAVYSSQRLGSVPSALRAAFISWMALLRRKVRTVYLVCSRSNGGFFRDVPALLLSFFGVRVVVHTHGSDIVELLCERLISPLARLLYSRCELIVPSPHLSKALEGIPLQAIHVCENFLPRLPANVRYGLSNPEDGLIVLWNSNIIRSKGFFDVVEAVRLARDSGHDIRFVALGAAIGNGGTTASETAAQVELLKQNEWFTYLGHITFEESVQKLALADVIALPSRYKSECQPLALIEAMCLGKRIIAADTPALRATLHGYPAVLLQDPSPEAIAEALIEALHAKKFRDAKDEVMLRDGSKRARRRFSVDRFDAQIAQILRVQCAAESLIS